MESSLQPSTTDFEPAPKDEGEKHSVLIIDDDKVSRRRLELLLTQTELTKNLQVLKAESLAEGVQILGTNSVQVLLLDKELKRKDPNTDSWITDDGIKSIPQILDISPTTQILVITASKEVEDCVAAMKAGALGYVTKSSHDDVVLAQINKAIMVSALTSFQIRKEREEQVRSGLLQFVGDSRAIKELRTKLKAVSETSRPVLLTGETGTGKTTAAKYIHELRGKLLEKKSRPFVALNIASLSPTVVERELFGNDRGAFTDAKEAKPGYFELANNGTLFLDEIGEASLDLQAKLLKVLDEGKFFRLGSTVERQSQFKLICATNRDLEKLIVEGKFREDLYMRISTFPVRVPTLQERKDDIPEIIRDLLPRVCRDNNFVILFEELPKDFIHYLQNTYIPGNLRGIERMLARLIVYSRKDSAGRPILESWRSIPGVLSKVHRSSSKNAISLNELFNAPLEIFTESFPGITEFLQDFEKRIVREAIESSSSQTDAAKLLNITRANLSNKCKRMRLKLRKYTSPKRTKRRSRR